MRRGSARFAATAFLFCAWSSLCGASPVGELCNRYLETYFKTFPTRATEVGQHEYDEQLEDLSEDALSTWVEFNRRARSEIVPALARKDLAVDDRLDGETLLSQIEQELHEQSRRPARDPLYWSGIIGNATVFLLVRDDLPLAERQRRACARAEKIPRLARQARDALAASDRSQISPELCNIASNQLRASSEFYRDGFPTAVDMANAGEKPATALLQLANFFSELAQNATGSPRLLKDYATSFRLGTRVDKPVTALLAQATADLDAKRKEAAAYGREVWPQIMGKQSPPSDDIELLKHLFERIAADQPSSIDEYFARWQENVRAIETFVRDKKIITLPDPLTLIVDRSPSFFVGQSVGGVYAAGPYAPDAKTIMFLPTPPADASAQQRGAFFRDFNEHFNKMIVPHELIPGHYVQLKIAAHQPHKIRTVFPDPVYVEGWGTFCERLLLDEGWGGPLERLAHLKKQLENIARVIVDIRVHTQEISRDEVVRFVTDEAMQGEQLASNMWTRALTTSPQITTYYLGYTKVRAIYDAARKRQGEKFNLQHFMDGMMELGPVSLEHYERKTSW